MSRRLLIAYAHPDDESFGLGALIARCAADGVEVTLICATDGDVGIVKPEFMAGYASAAEVRLAELACAADVLHLHETVLFHYKDSGMMGAPTTADPACLWQHWQTDPDSVTRRVIDVIRRVRPHAVITFNRYGGYGHPDHIAIQGAATRAFHAAGDPALVTDYPPYQPPKLYYSSIPVAQLKWVIRWLKLRGKDPRAVGRNADIDLVKILEHGEPTHTHIDIRAHLETWERANACHASQLGGRTPRLPLWLRRRLAPVQSFTRVHPPLAPGESAERDLFAGLPPLDPSDQPLAPVMTRQPA